MTEHQANIGKRNEIDLIELAKVLWHARRIIIGITLVFALLGLLIAVFSPNKYTTSVTIVSESSKNQANLENLGELAAISGIKINTPAEANISPATYPQIISSIPFQLELMNTPLTFSKIDHPVTLYEYYSEYVKPNFFYRYTIGLLETSNKTESLTDNKVSDGIIHISKEQKKICDILRKNISLYHNQKEGYVKLSCSMSEALPSAQLAQQAQELLQKKITDYKIQKATANLEFIQQQCNEIKQQYNQAQSVLAKFNDSNKNITTAVAQTELERLRNNYNLAFAIYSGMAKQLEQAKIQVKEDTPVFTIIEPASVPLKKSSPNITKTLIIFIFIGVIVGIGTVILKEMFKTQKCEDDI
jgi:Chain length determinant protein